jgi:hypothetical protein
MTAYFTSIFALILFSMNAFGLSMEIISPAFAQSLDSSDKRAADRH